MQVDRPPSEAPLDLEDRAPWRDLREEYGPWGTAWNLFDKWNGDGTLDETLLGSAPRTWTPG